MKISAHMDISQLAEHMGGWPTLSHIQRMRELIAASDYNDTKDIPESEWIAWLILADKGPQ
jgi:hypothetical protein